MGGQIHSGLRGTNRKGFQVFWGETDRFCDLLLLEVSKTVLQIYNKNVRCDWVIQVLQIVKLNSNGRVFLVNRSERCDFASVFRNS